MLIGVRLQRLGDQRFVRDLHEGLSTVDGSEALKAKLREIFILTELDKELVSDDNDRRDNTLESRPCTFKIRASKYIGITANKMVALYRARRGGLQSQTLPVWRDDSEILFENHLQPLEAVGIVFVYDGVNLTIIFGHRQDSPWLNVLAKNWHVTKLVDTPLSLRGLENGSELTKSIDYSMKHFEVGMKAGQPSKFCRDHAILNIDSTLALVVRARKDVGSFARIYSLATRCHFPSSRRVSSYPQMNTHQKQCSIQQTLRFPQIVHSAGQGQHILDNKVRI